MRALAAPGRLVAGVAVLLAAACASTTDPPAGTGAAGTDEPWPVHPDPGEPTCDDPLGCYDAPRRAGSFDAARVPGASGLATSRANPGVHYLLDDRPGTSEVWTVRADGVTAGAIEVDGLDAVDTEALAVAPCGEGDAAWCVYVGDIGDNLRSRDHIAVHRFPEPDLSAGVPDRPVAADVARLTYPDGPQDAEALLVDDSGALLVVTKAPFDRESRETGQTRLYRSVTFADGALEPLGPLPVPEPQAPLHSLLVGNAVTGGDHRDGRVLLRTYDQVLEYIAPEGADLTGLAGWTVRAVPSPDELQSEAIAWADCGYVTAGESSGDLWYVPCRL